MGAEQPEQPGCEQGERLVEPYPAAAAAGGTIADDVVQPSDAVQPAVQLLQASSRSSSSSHGGGAGVLYVDTAVQTVETGEAGVQYEPPLADLQELQQQLASPALAAFLCRAVPIAEQALQQNELADALQDDFAGLADEDAQEGGSGAADKVAVYQSFTDMVHSKGRMLTAVAWHPARKNVMAVTCAELLDLTEHSQLRGEPGRPRQQQPAILLWDYKEPMHPEVVLQAPADVLEFAFNPAAPQWVAAGCVGGQVVLWNLDQLAAQHEQAARLQLGCASGGGGTASKGSAGSRRSTVEIAAAEGAEAAAAFLRANVLQPAYVSMLDASHQACVTDLAWLPGLAATRDGRLEPAASPGECNLFATTAMDGKVLVWDMRIHAGRRRARGTATEDDVLDWKPVLALPVQSASSQPLSCTRFSLDLKPSCTMRLVVGSLEGDMAVVDANIRAVDSSRAHCAVAHAASSCGRVRTLAFSPFFDNLLLAVGDLGFLVWQDGQEGGGLGQQPLMESRFSEVLYTTGCWSPTKPGVVLLGRLDGKLEIWDLLTSTVVVAPITPAAILALAFSPGPVGAASRSSTHPLLAVADAAGVLHVVDVPRTLRRRAAGEISTMAALVEREQSRTAFVQERQAVRAELAKKMEPKRRSSIQSAQNGVPVASKSSSATGCSTAAGGKKVARETEEEGAMDPEQRAELAYLALEDEWRAKLGLPARLPSAVASARSLRATASTMTLK